MADAEDPEDPPRKKKRTQTPKQDGLRPALDEADNERPRFLLSFPEDPQLEPLIVAFESGNYAYVREHAGKVAEQTSDEAVRLAALELRRRIDPDPLMRYLLIASVVLLLCLTGWTYMNRGAHVLGPADHAGHEH